MFAPGTIIEDVVGGKRSVHGAKSHQSDVENRIAQNAQNNLAIEGEPATALPPTSRATLWVVIASVISLVLVAATVFLRRHTRLFVFWLIMVGITLPCRSEDDAEGEMAKIATAHKHWRESIVSVRFVWETVGDPHAPLVKGTKYEGAKRTGRYEFIWCDDGRFRLHSAGRNDDGPEIFRSLKCGDGQRSYSMRYDDGPSELEKPVSVQILPTPTPGQGSGVMLVPLDGLWFSGRLYWLAELISQGAVTFDGYVDVNGERSPRIKVERYTDLFVSIVLNREKGYLPRSVQEGGNRSEILSYRHFEPGLWFPWTGSLTTSSDTTTWEMKEIEVNSQLDPKLFQPVHPPGTTIEDVVSGKRSVYGAKSHQSDVENRIALDAQNNLALGGESVTALPPTSGATLWVVIASVISLILVAATVFLRRRTRLFLFCLMMVGITTTCRSEDDAEGEMAKIAAAHKHWRESIVSVRFVWESSHDPHAKLVKGTRFDGVKRTARDEFIWCDDGRYRLHYAGRHDDGPEILRTLRCGDGKRSYSMKYGDGPSELEKPVTVNILPAPTPGHGGGMMLAPLDGLWFSGRLYWLTELISLGSVTFDGYVEVKGERSPRIRVERAPDTFTTVVLNPEKGYLPRLVEEGHFRSEILSYRQFEPELWFPWTGTFTASVDTVTWEMKEIQVNSQLDPKLFQPLFAPGTVIEDGLGGKRTVYGATSQPSDVEQRIVQNAQDNLAVAGEPVTAHPPTFGAMSWIVTGSLVSLGLAASAIYFRRRA